MLQPTKSTIDVYSSFLNDLRVQFHGIVRPPCVMMINRMRIFCLFCPDQEPGTINHEDNAEYHVAGVQAKESGGWEIDELAIPR